MPKKDSLKSILSLLNGFREESVIIYCFSRNNTERLVENLNKYGLKVAAYHAGLDVNQRRENQEKFIRDEINIIVATIAFGMGIDKPDVRLVIHHSLPKSIEGYYQETGRAGRDGLPARCVLFFSYADKFKHDYFIRNMADETERQKSQEKLEHVLQYGNFNGCRRQFLLHYFNETYDQNNCGNCDGCVAQAPLEIYKASFNTPKTRDVFSLSKDNVYDNALFEELRKLRTQEAQRLNVPPYMIFGDKALHEMATSFPQTTAAFLEINGVGNRKLLQFGKLFMSAVRCYIETYKIQENTGAESYDMKKAYSVANTRIKYPNAYKG